MWALFTASSAAACLAPDAVPGSAGTGGSTTGETGGGGSSAAPLAWAYSYGMDAPSDQRAWTVAASSKGDAIVGGDFQGSLSIPPLAELPNTDGRDAFVVSFDASGEAHDLLGFSGGGDQIVHRAIPTPDGGVLVAGSYTVALSFAGEDLGNAPLGKDGFLARVAADHSLQWLVRASGDGDQTIQSVAVTPSGEAIVAGTFENGLTLGGMVLAGSGAGGREIFVARIDASGKPTWIKSLRGKAPDLSPLPACFVALDASGGIHVAGTFGGTMSLGEDLGAIGSHDMFVGQLDASGKPVWGHAMGSAGVDQRVASLAVGPAGETLISADLRGKVTLGGDDFAADGEGPDAFLAVFGAAGVYTWAHRYGSAADDHAGSAAFDPEGDILFTGTFRGAISFSGDPPLLNAEAASANDDIFFVELTPDHTPVFARAFGEKDDQIPTSLAVDPDGHPFLTGWFRGLVDFGGGPLDAKNGADLFIARFGK